MARKKKVELTMRGSQLLASGDIIHVMHEGSPVKCRVLSCLGIEDAKCLANLEILEGDRKGDRISTTLSARNPSDDTGAP
ncbi:MAG TPA: hypothetical protein VK463_12040 [Desulfomonilaceae bacterium]|nr:hypothetical protein [Desulfomonilaceae bacterium]